MSLVETAELTVTEVVRISGTIRRRAHM
jgi:hypothetical protein